MKKKYQWPWVLRRRLVDEKNDHEMTRGCLDMIHEVLEPRISMEGCPPMFYPEAIVNIANLPRRAIMRATGCDEKYAAKATEDELVALIKALRPVIPIEDLAP